MAQRRRVLITGGTGALGPAVLRAFNTHGWDVATFSRHSPAGGSIAAAHPHYAGDIRDREALSAAMTGAHVVVHMAALLHVVNPSAELQAEYARTNVDGTAAVVDAAERAAVDRVVFLSSIAVYGPQKDVVDETTPPQPDTPYASSKLASEGLALAVTSAEGAPLATVLRLAAVYGPHIKGNYKRLIRELARGRFVPIGTGANSRTLVFEEDAARAIVLAATHASAAGQVFNVTDGEVHTVSEITAAICRALGRRPPRLAIPLLVAQAAAASLEAGFLVIGQKAPITRTTLQKYTEHVAVSGDRIREVLGFVPNWSLEKGWSKTVAELKRAGEL